MSYQPVGNEAVASSRLALAQLSDWKRGTEPLKGDTMQQLSYCCSQIKDVCQNKDSWSSAGRSRRDMMSSFLINKYSLDGLVIL